MINRPTVSALVLCLWGWVNQPLLAQPGDQGDFELYYAEAENPDFNDIAQAFHESQLLESVLADLNATLILPQQVPVALAECGVANAFYSPDDTAIVLCYELIAEFAEVFMAEAETQEDRQLAADSVFGATLFILFHELGHALVDLFELPITGREEDAVDQLATLMLVESGDPDVEASALDGADFFFAMADQGSLSEEAYWDEHSLDLQRFYNVLCWVYGSDPEGWFELVDSGELPADRADRCPDEYDQLANAWDILLEPYLK